MTNETLIKLFTSKSSLKGKNHTGALSFIGNKIFSYDLLIGEYIDRSEEGFIGLLIHDHMATGLHPKPYLSARVTTQETYTPSPTNCTIQL